MLINCDPLTAFCSRHGTVAASVTWVHRMTYELGPIIIPAPYCTTTSTCTGSPAANVNARLNVRPAFLATST